MGPSQDQNQRWQLTRSNANIREEVQWGPCVIHNDILAGRSTRAGTCRVRRKALGAEQVPDWGSVCDIPAICSNPGEQGSVRGDSLGYTLHLARRKSRVRKLLNTGEKRRKSTAKGLSEPSSLSTFGKGTNTVPGRHVLNEKRLRNSRKLQIISGIR